MPSATRIQYELPSETYMDQLLTDGAKLFDRGGVDHIRERLERENRKLKETIGELTIVCDVIASSICRLYHGRPQYAKPKDDDDEHQPAKSVSESGPLSSIDLTKDLKPDQPEPPKEQKAPQASATPAPSETQTPKPPSADEH